MLVPMAPADKALFARVAREGYDAALKQTTRFWRRTLKPSCISIPEQPLNQAIYNSVRFSHMLTERDPATGKHCKVNGSWSYNDLWATPGAMDLTMLMDTLGYHDFIEPYLELFREEQGTAVPPGLRHYWTADKETPGQKKGIFEQHPGYLAPPRKYRTIDWITDNGAIVYAISLHGLLSGNKAYIDRVCDTIVRSCEWIRDARALRGHDGYEGVLPPAVNSDNGTVVQGVWGVGWNYLGLTKAVRLLERMEHPRAKEFEAERKAYKRDFLRAFRDRVSRMPTWRDRRGRTRRVIPSTLVGGGNDIKNPFSLDAGALVLVFSGLLRANDPIMKDCLAWFRDGPHVSSFRPESGCWQMPVLVHEMSSCEPCYSWNLFHTLQSGDKPRFLEGLYSLYAGGLSRQTWISCETRGGVTGNVFAVPLATYLTRLCLLDDTWKDDELHVLRMVPPEWLKLPGLSLVRMPTEYGPVTLASVISKNGAKLDIRYRAEFFAAPRKVVLHLPRIDGVRETRLNGKPVKGRTVVL